MKLPERGRSGSGASASAVRTEPRTLPASLVRGSAYEACRTEVAIRMGRFFVQHLMRLHREFDGDLEQVIPLGEIGHQNASGLRFVAGSGAWSAWDERFIEFIDRHRAAPLLAGKAGAEFFVVFSPSGRAGFWVVAQVGGAHGKGFLGAKDVERLTNLAASRGLA